MHYSTNAMTMEAILSAILSLLLVFTGNVSVAGQTLVISFEDIGLYDYNGGKAFMEGDQVELQCDVSGQVPESYRIVYARDNVKLTSNRDILVSNDDQHYSVQHNIFSISSQQYNLFINGVGKDDQGYYSCKLENAGGQVVYTAQFSQLPGQYPEIVVLYLPDENRYPECIVEEGTIDVKVGSSLTLTCSSELGNPEVSLSWRRTTDSGQSENIDSTPIRSEDKISNQAPSITITADYDGDIFTCYMKPSQQFFPAALRFCEVGPLNIVSDVPLPSIMPIVQNAVPGDTVTFQCALSDQPNAVFTWHWEPNWVFSKEPVSPDTRSFSLLNVQSYHHMTKVFCETTSQGVKVSVYGLIRVSGPYVEPPNTPAPPANMETRNPPGGGGSGRTDRGGLNPTSETDVSRGGGGMTTESSSQGTLIQATNVKLAVTCVFVIVLFAGGIY